MPKTKWNNKTYYCYEVSRISDRCYLICLAGEIKDGRLRIGNTEIQVHNPDTKMKVPDVLFYDNVQVSLCFNPLNKCCATHWFTPSFVLSWVVGHLIVVQGWMYTSLPCPFNIPLPYPPLMPSPPCTAKSLPPEWSSIALLVLVTASVS